MRTVSGIVVLAALVSTVVGAQEPKPAFEVASVKRNMLGEPGGGGPTATFGSRPTGFVAVNVTLRQLIGTAYGVEGVSMPELSDRLVGGPSWVQTYRFDINARTGQEVSRQQANAMLRTLLEERFKLVVATEQRQRNAYALRLVRADGRLGPDLRKAAEGASPSGPDPF